MDGIEESEAFHLIFNSPSLTALDFDFGIVQSFAPPRFGEDEEEEEVVEREPVSYQIFGLNFFVILI